ncbi:MAG: hypothetical protein AB7O88_15635 [Reyranellaceae bacterium]
MFRRRAPTQSGATSTVSQGIDALRALSNLLTIVCFGGAIAIVVMTFTRVV